MGLQIARTLDSAPSTFLAKHRLLEVLTHSLLLLCDGSTGGLNWFELVRRVLEGGSGKLVQLHYIRRGLRKPRWQ